MIIYYPIIIMTRLDYILEFPDLVLLVEQINEYLKDEAQRRREFREWVTPNVKAEFINGEVILHSPVKRGHLEASGSLYTLLNAFVKIKNLGKTSYDKGMISLTRNDYEPDICFWGTEKSADFTEETMLHPAPDFVVEVLSKKTAKADRTTKFRDYAAHGIPEYWIIDSKNKMVEQYHLASSGVMEYELVGKWSEKDQITSRIIKGFSVPVNAIFDDKICIEVLKTLLTT